MSYHKMVRCDKCKKTSIYTDIKDDFKIGYRHFSFVDHNETRHFHLCHDCMKWLYNNIEIEGRTIQEAQE